MRITLYLQTLEYGGLLSIALTLAALWEAVSWQAINGATCCDSCLCLAVQGKSRG